MFFWSFESIPNSVIHYYLTFLKSLQTFQKWPALLLLKISLKNGNSQHLKVFICLILFSAIFSFRFGFRIIQTSFAIARNVCGQYHTISNASLFWGQFQGKPTFLCVLCRQDSFGFKPIKSLTTVSELDNI